MQRKKSKIFTKIIPAIATAFCITAFFLIGRSLTYQDMLNWVPESHTAAGFLILLLYAAKSLTIFFPLVTLYLLSGIIFPLPHAILVNIAGLIVCDTIPYFIGRLLGLGHLEALRRKYPKLEIMETLRQKNGIQFATLTRAIGLLPGDVVSLYFGCVGLNYPAYLVGSILGLAPGMVATTVLGHQINAPEEPGFWIAAGFGAAVALISFFACGRTVKQALSAKAKGEKGEHI